MRKKLTAIIIAVFVFSLIAASAASLGGINQADLGADVEVVASCDTDGVSVAYNLSYQAGTPSYYAVASVDVTAINTNCNGYNIDVTLAGSGAALDSGSSTVGAGAANVTFTGVDAEAVDEIAIAISG
jgi:hypothetical protein